MSSRTAERRLRALVDRAEPTVRAQAERALASLRASVSVEALERAIRTRDAFALHDIAATLPARLRPMVATLERLFVAGAQAGRAALPRMDLRLRFDAANPFAVAEARDHAARLVVEVTRETREAIRAVVARAFEEGIPPREAAQLIRPLVGLTTRQAQAVASLRADLIARGASRTAALREAQAYAGALLKRRALTIARTETIAASSRGQLAAWDDAARRGLIGARSRKVWITTPDDRLCPRCRPLDGKQAALDGTFVDRLGTAVKAPPLHPNCRCAIGLVSVAAPAARRRAA